MVAVIIIIIISCTNYSGWQKKQRKCCPVDNTLLFPASQCVHSHRMSPSFYFNLYFCQELLLFSLFSLMYLHFAWQSSFIIFYFWKKRFLCTADNLFESFSQSFTVRSKFDGQYFFLSSHKYLTTHNLGYYNHRSNNFILWNLIRTRKFFPEFLTTALNKSHHSPTQQLPSSTSD